MDAGDLERRITDCRTEVDSALDGLHKRLESVEHIQQLIHSIYKSTQHTEERVSNLLVSFSSYAAKQESISKAFPGEDVDGHRRAHEAWIRKEQAKAAFWEKIRDEAAKWGVLGVLGFIVGAIWLAIKNEVHK